MQGQEKEAEEEEEDIAALRASPWDCSLVASGNVGTTRNTLAKGPMRAAPRRGSITHAVFQQLFRLHRDF